MSKFKHSETADITLVDMPSQDVLITVGTDKVLKVWNRKTEKITHSYISEKHIIQIQYCKRNEMIAFMDVECSIGVIPLQLESVCNETGN